MKSALIYNNANCKLQGFLALGMPEGFCCYLYKRIPNNHPGT